MAWPCVATCSSQAEPLQPGYTFTAAVTFASSGIDPVTGLSPPGANYTAGDGTKGVNWTTLKPYVDAALTGTPLQ